MVNASPKQQTGKRTEATATQRTVFTACDFNRTRVHGKIIESGTREIMKSISADRGIEATGTSSGRPRQRIVRNHDVFGKFASIEHHRFGIDVDEARKKFK